MVAAPETANHVVGNLMLVIPDNSHGPDTACEDTEV